MKRAALALLNLLQWLAAMNAVLGVYGVIYGLCVDRVDAGTVGLAGCGGLVVWATAILKAEVDRG